MKKITYIIIIVALAIWAFLQYETTATYEDNIAAVNYEHDLEYQDGDENNEDFVEENPELTQFDEETIIAE